MVLPLEEVVVGAVDFWAVAMLNMRGASSKMDTKFGDDDIMVEI